MGGLLRLIGVLGLSIDVLEVFEGCLIVGVLFLCC